MIHLIHPNGPTGRIIHDRNCTRCKHRKSVRGGKNKPEIELCGLSGYLVPAPDRAGRYCDGFQQEHCPCLLCN